MAAVRDQLEDKSSPCYKLYEVCSRINSCIEEDEMTREERINFFKKEGKLTEEALKSCNELFEAICKHYPRLKEIYEQSERAVEPKEK